jgi:UDP-2,3-diacylglucosamine hydrolase
MIKGDALAIYFLGDMFDYWYEYRYVVPRGYVRFLGKLAELNDKGIELHMLYGNHDIWMSSYFAEELGVRIHQGPLTLELLGSRFLLAHGDEVGKRTYGFRMLGWLFRNRFCWWLYGGIHPRWTFGLARYWSRYSRLRGEELSGDLSSSRYLTEYAEGYNKSGGGIDYFLFGHCHVLLDTGLGSGGRVLIVGDWLRHFSYAVWDGTLLELCSAPSFGTRVVEDICHVTVDKR